MHKHVLSLTFVDYSTEMSAVGCTSLWATLHPNKENFKLKKPQLWTRVKRFKVMSLCPALTTHQILTGFLDAYGDLLRDFELQRWCGALVEPQHFVCQHYDPDELLQEPDDKGLWNPVGRSQCLWHAELMASSPLDSQGWDHGLLWFVNFEHQHLKPVESVQTTSKTKHHQMLLFLCCRWCNY